MEQLKTEYIDVKSIKHRVEHRTLPPDGNADKERLVEELALVLKPGGKTPA